MNRRRAFLVAAVSALAVLATACVTKPPAGAGFDYQIGGDYTAPSGVTVVSRDWFSGSPLTADDTYSICYVNAFQTQGDYEGVDRPDEKSNWPANLVLDELGDDPNWGGEYLIDLSTAAKRTEAAAWVDQMIDGCAASGFDGVEFDNLDSWTRFDGTPLEGSVPFGQAEAVAYAALITEATHAQSLASGQKNTPQLSATESLDTIGFDFAVTEQCGEYSECTDYTDVFGDLVYDIEYTDTGFATACASIGSTASVVRRDVNVSAAGDSQYVFAHC